MAIDYGNGNDSTVSFGTGSGSEIGSISDIKVTTDAKDIDGTTFGDEYEGSIIGLKKMECSLTVVGYPDSILGVGDTGDLSVSFGSVTALTVTGCVIKKVEIGHKAGDKITVSYSIGKTKV